MFMRFLPNYQKPQGMLVVFYTPLLSTTLTSALDIGMRLFGSNKKLVPKLSSWGKMMGLIKEGGLSPSIKIGKNRRHFLKV